MLELGGGFSPRVRCFCLVGRVLLASVVCVGLFPSSNNRIIIVLYSSFRVRLAGPRLSESITILLSVMLERAPLGVTYLGDTYVRFYHLLLLREGNSFSVALLV